VRLSRIHKDDLAPASPIRQPKSEADP